MNLLSLTPDKQLFYGFCKEILITLVIVLGFTTLILFMAGAPPFAAWFYLFKGSLGSWIKISQVIKVWIPLTLCACGLLFTFRIGLWNIGVEGQIVMGAIFTTMILKFAVNSNSAEFYLILSMIAAIIGGALWAFLGGLLKTRGGINEIFAGLGLNFVAQGMTLWLIFGPWKRPGTASMSGTELFPRDLWLTCLNSLRLSPAGILIAISALILTALLLRYAKIGLYLKAIGNNASAAFLFGLQPGHYMLLAMIFAGGMAGLAGAFQVNGVYHRLIPAISSNYGYLALLVVMLANYNVWLAPLVAFFFACLNVGSIQLPMMLKLDSSLCGVIQGSLVLATLFVQAFRHRISPERTKNE